ncbi:MAG: histidine phosphatase family protein [Geminicoccaceae bacterium]|nr:histidine phosphatase family protein [Geminicoccaceae bacterium]
MAARELLLLRHAKSRQGGPGVNDHNRALAPSGLEDAPRVGAYLKGAGLVPDRVLTSSATRARQTTDLVLKAAGFEGEPKVRTELYLAKPPAILAAVRGLPNGCRRAMLVGHNPGLEQATLKLVGDGPPDLVDAVREKFPTAALVHLVFQADAWGEAGFGKGSLQAFVRPRDLG